MTAALNLGELSGFDTIALLVAAAALMISLMLGAKVWELQRQLDDHIDDKLDELARRKP
jgi:hypothetical protein